MNKRRKVSASIGFKKYFLSWFILVVVFLITSYFSIGKFWSYIAWIIGFFVAALYSSLKKVEFDEEGVFFNNKKYKYSSIIGFKSFEINNRLFYIFKTDSKNILKKYHFTQLAGLNYFSLAKTLFSKKRVEDLPISEFLSLIDEKSNVKKYKSF
ncbi:hypothetical protein [Winogradskyella sp. SYSU M77433]|uniref:hypothetical protein n=1 Tax=Winogradskyella sp. SYSU M77433 TaxID=3042722 RepID=UPI002480FB5A|nr:hypothetical protein [Winogradskyella sp. SYSU M77433]MDH7912578.1 hypothetical protein [Winogradskyella sp. SYSU M77433]